MERIDGMLQTPDGYWRVEVVRSGRDVWYRIRHAETIVAEKASIATVQRILEEDFAKLQQVDAA